MNRELTSIETTCSLILLECTKCRNETIDEDQCQETVIKLLRNMVSELKSVKEVEY